MRIFINESTKTKHAVPARWEATKNYEETLLLGDIYADCTGDSAGTFSVAYQ